MWACKTAHISYKERKSTQRIFKKTFRVVAALLAVLSIQPATAKLNRDLSNNSAQRMVEILRQYATVPDRLVHVNSRGVNWEDVIEMVEADVMVPSRDKVLMETS